MALSLNRASILGRAGRAAELRTTNSGAPVANFTVATTSRWKGKDGTPQEETTWHNVTAWGTLATLCSQIVQQGQLIYVDGPMVTQQFEGRDGTQKTKTYIKADQVVSLATGKDRVANGGEGAVMPPKSQASEKESEWTAAEMPF